MIDQRPDGGFGYRVSDEQLEAYAKFTPLQRLQWLDEARQFLLLALSPKHASGRSGYGAVRP